MDLGSYVSERRKKLGLVQSVIATQLHYSIQAISRFEQGQSQLSLTAMPHLADLLEESFDDLLHCVSDPLPFSGVNKEINSAAFAANLISARKGKGLSQKELSLKLGIGERSIQNYEKGNSLPSPDVALAMADFFALAPSAFFCEALAQGGAVIKVKKGWRFFIVPALIVVVVGGGGVGIAYGLGALWKGAGSGSNSTLTPGDSGATSETTGDTSTSDTSTSSSSDVGDVYPGFPGLKSVKFVSEDGTDLAPGYHTVSLVSEPAAYFAGLSSTNALALSVNLDNVDWPTHTGISYSQADASDPYSPINLKITGDVTNRAQMVFQFSSTYNHHTLGVPATITLYVDNTSGDLNSEFFPGLKSFLATVSKSSSGPFSQLLSGDPGLTYYLSYSCSPSDYISKALASTSSSFTLNADMPTQDTSIDSYALSYNAADANAGVAPLPFKVPDGAPEGKAYPIGYDLHKTVGSTDYSVHTTVKTPYTVHYSA
jgi:transcriptional regulator with XRE-family HTH domain